MTIRRCSRYATLHPSAHRATRTSKYMLDRRQLRSPSVSRASRGPSWRRPKGGRRQAPQRTGSPVLPELPSVGYALTQRRRAAAGWVGLAGNHVLIETRHGPAVALCHLQQGGVQVRLGENVRVGQTLARCGNSGDSTEPHVHLQAIGRLDVLHTSAVPITFGGHLPRNGEIIDAR